MCILKPQESHISLYFVARKSLVSGISVIRGCFLPQHSGQMHPWYRIQQGKMHLTDNREKKHSCQPSCLPTYPQEMWITPQHQARPACTQGSAHSLLRSCPMKSLVPKSVLGLLYFTLHSFLVKCSCAYKSG